MVKFISRYPIIIISLLILLLLIDNQTQEKLKANWANVVIAKAWLSVDDTEPINNFLNDGIPDYWYVANWGKARSSVLRDENNYFLESPSISIKKNNDSDTSLLFQDITITPEKEVTCVVYHRGADAFFRVIAEGFIGQSIILLPKTDEWLASSLTFSLKPDYGTAKVLFGISGLSGEAWFDQVNCSYSGLETDNLVINGNFEQDGSNEKPREWWTGLLPAKSVVRRVEKARDILLTNPSPESPLNHNLVNSADLLSAHYDHVIHRMKNVSSGCLGIDGNPSILLGLASRFQEENNLTASEQAALLAIELMPKCPQPYAWLGSLYLSANAFQKAANLYHEAASLSSAGGQRGAYLFDQGYMYVVGTGDYSRAIEVLTQAQENEGWERSPWYRGAALIELGKAFYEEGMCGDAQAAYQSVIDCPECSARHSSAISGLQDLTGCIP
jgi:hypothetical protein